MKLFYKNGACSLASHIMLYEVGADFEIELVDTKSGRTASGRDYRQINANGYVPSLQIDNDLYLNEGVAILQYIADTHAEKAFSPPLGSVARARLQQFLSFAGSELHKAWGPLFADGSTGEEKAASAKKVASKFDYLDGVLADGRDYLVDNRFSVADAYSFVLILWSNFKGIDLDRWPRLKAYADRIGSRPSARSAMAAEGLA